MLDSSEDDPGPVAQEGEGLAATRMSKRGGQRPGSHTVQARQLLRIGIEGLNVFCPNLDLTIIDASRESNSGKRPGKKRLFWGLCCSGELICPCLLPGGPHSLQPGR